MNQSNEPKKEFHYFRHILFCTDFSENADFAFDYALEQASRYPNCTLTLLHIIPEPESQFWQAQVYELDNVDEKAKQDIETKIATSYTPRIPPNIQFEVEIKIGKEYMEIFEFARKQNVDLIVIGRQGRSSLQTVLFGNVMEKITRHAECPVLVIPSSYQKKVKKN